MARFLLYLPFAALFVWAAALALAWATGQPASHWEVAVLLTWLFFVEIRLFLIDKKARHV